MNNVDAILCADIHMRPSTPQARTDDFTESLFAKWAEINKLSHTYNAPVLVAGDLGHKPDWPGWLLRRFIQQTTIEDLYVIPGQHDLPYHNIDNWHKSALGVLEAAEVLYFLDGKGRSPSHIEGTPIFLFDFPWGLGFDKRRIGPAPDDKDVRKAAMTHQLIMEGKDNKEDFPGSNAQFGKDVLMNNPRFDLILSGDNHKPFVIEYDGRLLVNPGSMMRSNADQINHRPRVYLWDARENTVRAHFLRINDNVITRQHIEEKKQKIDRMEAFITTIKDEMGTKLSFPNTILQIIDELKPSESVIKKLWECVGDE